MAGFYYSGHTELLADRLNSKKFAMVMIAGNIKVLLATTHIPLKDVSRQLSAELLAEKILIGYEFLQRTGKRSPVIGVSALNPHGGECGVIGKEEGKIIEPVVRKMRKKVSTAKALFLRMLFSKGR